MKVACAVAECNLKRVLDTDGTGSQRLDCQRKVLGRTRRRGKVEDVIHWARIKRPADIPFDKIETRFIGEMRDVLCRSGGEIVEANHCLAFTQQSIDKMGAKETGGAGN